MSQEARNKLLHQMYDQMFNDIDRHITTTWQPVAALLGSITVFALGEKAIIATDVASSLGILIAAWLLAHLQDASYWYNRNLVIVANIEREFLNEGDLKLIHYYFGKHRPGNKMIQHFRIHYALGLGIALVILTFHFFTRVTPGIGEPSTNFELQRTLPYLTAMCTVLYLFWLFRKRKDDYEELIENSPGKVINTDGIRYGTGHGFAKSSKKKKLL